jgi:hypothetical protein
MSAFDEGSELEPRQLVNPVPAMQRESEPHYFAKVTLNSSIILFFEDFESAS